MIVIIPASDYVSYFQELVLSKITYMPAAGRKRKKRKRKKEKKNLMMLLNQRTAIRSGEGDRCPPGFGRDAV
jgi:hypothetical protein